MTKRAARSDASSEQWSHLQRHVFPLLGKIADDSGERDKAGNWQFAYAQHASLILVGLFNPTLDSARAFVAGSGAKGGRKLTGRGKVSVGLFCNAPSVLAPNAWSR